MTNNQMVVSMWTEIDEIQAENLNGGSGRPKPPTVTFTVKNFSTNVNQSNGGDGTIKDITFYPFWLGFA